MKFDPQATRRNLKGFEIALYREESIAEAKKQGALNGTGWGMSHCGIRCLLVGFFDVGRELLLKASTFVRASIDTGEKPFLGAHHRFEDLALLNWLVGRQHDEENLKAAVQSREMWFSEQSKASKKEVQLALRSYLDAEEYEPLLQRYESVGLRGPASLKRIQGEGTMCYVVARHRMGLQYTSEDIDSALDTFLKRRVPGWLDRGLYSVTAHWMKLAFWKKGDDPIATLLRCYDYLPGLKAPKYP